MFLRKYYFFINNRFSSPQQNRAKNILKFYLKINVLLFIQFDNILLEEGEFIIGFESQKLKITKQIINFVLNGRACQTPPVMSLQFDTSFRLRSQMTFNCVSLVQNNSKPFASEQNAVFILLHLEHIVSRDYDVVGGEIRVVPILTVVLENCQRVRSRVARKFQLPLRY